MSCIKWKISCQRGGCDDRICVYDLAARQEIEDLYIHDGTVNSLQFVPDCYLISCGADGKIAFTKTNYWKVDKTFEKAHKGSSVNYVSVHSSGKLALSIANDMILRTWNLINGRQAFATSHKNKAFGNRICCVVYKWRIFSHRRKRHVPQCMDGVRKRQK